MIAGYLEFSDREGCPPGSQGIGPDDTMEPPYFGGRMELFSGPREAPRRENLPLGGKKEISFQGLNIGSPQIFGLETALGVQWLGLCASTAGDGGSMPGGGTKIIHAAWRGLNKTNRNPKYLWPLPQLLTYCK